MRRADRLFQIVTHLRRRRAVTARELSQALEVSERTIYRDIQDLMASGVPIDGAAGVGYVLRPGFDLPPLMFTLEEVLALRVGARFVESWADPEMARAANSALLRMDAILPEALRKESEEPAIYAPGFFVPLEVRARVGQLRNAIRDQNRVRVKYQSQKEEVTERVLQPLALMYWGASWTLGAWCELREGFRSFRLDRFQSVEILPGRLIPAKGRTRDDMIAYFQASD